MSTEIKTWQIVGDKLSLVETNLAAAGKTENKHLEEWAASDTSLLGPDLLLIGRQVQTKSGPLDLLAIDRDGNTVVIELKRDRLPREALAQAVDYASDIAEWSLERLSEVCAKYTGMSLEDALADRFADIDLETITINETQRILLVGFAIESALERMIEWLSSSSGVSINAVLLHYMKTVSGDQILTRTSIISEEVEQARLKKTKKFTIPMSDDPGDYDEETLEQLLSQYLSSSLHSARRIRDVLIPACLEHGRVTRDQIKEEFLKSGEIEELATGGYFLSLISGQIGMAKNDFLRQVIGYEYPNNPWEKDNYHIRPGYEDLCRKLAETPSAPSAVSATQDSI
jgi:hypothetical protein